jgi:hypothetical protein
MGSRLGSGLLGRRRRPSMDSHPVDHCTSVSCSNVPLHSTSCNRMVEGFVARWGNLGMWLWRGTGVAYGSHNSRLPVELYSKTSVYVQYCHLVE